MPFSFHYLKSLASGNRVAYVEEHVDEIAGMSDKQKEQIASLLCRDSSDEAKKACPIIGDNPFSPQEIFEQLAPEVGIERAAEQAAYEEKVWQ